MKKIKVSIVCISYNQENYIRQTLDGFVSQETKFSYEIIVADDRSSDATPVIIEEYAKKYPDLIKPILRTKNLGPQENFADALRKATGDYIALCEGDDFWIDPLKLQKQADFLDSHGAYDLVFHPVRVFFENHEEEDAVYPLETNEKRFNLKNLLKNNFIQTNSVMYRKVDYSNLSTDIMPFDWYLHLFHVRDGKIGFIDEVMSAYRRHAGGIWWNQHSQPELIWKKYAYSYLKLLHEIMLLHGNKSEHRQIINSHIYGSFEAIASVGSDDSVDGMVMNAISEMPLETWEYLKHLMQQVDHYSRHDAYLQSVLEHEAGQLEQAKNENTHLAHELGAIKSSRPWKIVHKLQQGRKLMVHPVREARNRIGRTRITSTDHKTNNTQD
jgi:glycosyltransferase involved in cell wall biosynthesis